VKGTLCKNLQWIQRVFVVFAPFWLVSFWGFRGDTGAVIAAFDMPIARENGCETANIGKNLFKRLSLEQLTLNQRVQGSSPCTPINIINDLRDDVPTSLARIQFPSDPASDLSPRSHSGWHQ
jgi:hypothetical protein